MSYQFGSFRLDVAEQRLLCDGHAVPLTPKVFEVLCLLVQNSGHLVTKERLLKEIWPDTFVEEANLNRAISVLRKVLGDDLERKYIETVPKRGYRFVAPVTAVIAPGPPSLHAPRRSVRAAFVGGALVSVGLLLYAVLGFRPSDTHAPTPRSPAHRQVTFAGMEATPTISSDGRRIAYVTHDSAERTVMVQDVAGGRPIAVFSAPEAARPRWSPDGSQLMIWARGSGRNGIYVIPQMGGMPRLIAPGQFIACWSPDGATIAVARYLAGKIAFVNAQSGNGGFVSLQGVHRWIWDMDWSPVDNRLVLASNDDEGRFSIWTMNADGSEQRMLLRDTTEISSVRWSLDGRAIYYFHRVNQTVSLSKIVRRSADQWDVVDPPLLTGLETDGTFGISANGRSFVYARSSYYSNLWTVERSGSGRPPPIVTKQLTRGTSLIERPRVSPDGQRIVFNIGHEALANLYVMPIAGGTPTQLTYLDAFSIGGVWSPDGTQIAFASNAGGKSRVWIVAANGGAARPVSAGDLSSDNFEVVWSPGAQILYQQTGNRNFFVLDPWTRHERPLLRDSSVGWIFSPIHSPSGNKIALAWNRRPKRGVWLIDQEDSQEELLYEGDPPLLIGWSADGASVFALEGGRPVYRGVVASRGETATEAKIVNISANDGKLQVILDLPFAEVGGVSMTPDGRTFVCTVYSSRSDVWVVDDFDPTLPI